MTMPMISNVARATARLLASLLLCISACTNSEDLGDRSGSGGTNGDESVPATKLLSETTFAERRRLCDRDAALFDGYGKNATCELREGVIQSIHGAGPNQETCVRVFDEVFAECDATVAEFERCRLHLVAGVCQKDAGAPACSAIHEKCPNIDLS